MAHPAQKESLMHPDLKFPRKNNTTALDVNET